MMHQSKRPGRFRVSPMTVVATVVAAALFLVARGSTAAPSAQTVKVGFLLPLTGNTAWGGKTARVAAEMARDEVNASGAAGPYKLELVFADGQCEPRVSYDAAEKLITQDKVQILVGEWCSSASLAIAQVAKDYGIPLLVHISTADGIAERGGPYTFQTIMQNKDINRREAGLLLKKFRFQTFAILVENNDFGLSFRQNMLRYLQAAGKKPVVDIRQDRSDTNFYPAITKIQGAKPDLIVFSLSAGQAANFVKAMAEAGLRIPVVSDYPPPPYIFEKQVGVQAAKIGLVRGTFYLDNPNMTPRQKQFTAKFEPMASQVAGEQRYATHWDIVSYDVVYLVAEALKKGGVEPAAFARALQSIQYDGVLGRYAFDTNRTVKPEGLPFVFIRNVEGGRLEVVQ